MLSAPCQPCQSEVMRYMLTSGDVILSALAGPSGPGVSAPKPGESEYTKVCPVLSIALRAASMLV